MRQIRNLSGVGLQGKLCILHGNSPVAVQIALQELRLFVDLESGKAVLVRAADADLHAHDGRIADIEGKLLVFHVRRDAISPEDFVAVEQHAHVVYFAPAVIGTDSAELEADQHIIFHIEVDIVDISGNPAVSALEHNALVEGFAAHFKGSGGILCIIDVCTLAVEGCIQHPFRRFVGRNQRTVGRFLAVHGKVTQTVCRAVLAFYHKGHNAAFGSVDLMLIPQHVRLDIIGILFAEFVVQIDLHFSVAHRSTVNMADRIADLLDVLRIDSEH